ncbi:MAG: amidase [Hyphomicrobiales bacterium]|nr:amidase [Hyphomicrobiales bacterium]
MGFTEFSDFDAVGLAELIRKKEVHPTELVDEVVERIERINPRLNAVVTPMFESAREAARDAPRGLFGGVPFLLKDAFFECAGVPLSNGSRFFRGYVPIFDSELVHRIKGSGLIVAAKTNTPEFALTPYTDSELFGACRNPWNEQYSAGGSSGGSAAAVAARIVPMAHASDGGGSIRIPASCCGLFGLKPTRARTPTGPSDIDAFNGALVGHAVSLTVRDSATLLDVLAGPESGAVYSVPPPRRPFAREVGADPGQLRIAFTSHPFLGHRVDPECIAALHRTVTLLQDLGHVVEDLGDVPTQVIRELDPDRLQSATLMIVSSWLAADIGRAEKLLGRRATSRDFEVQTWLMALFGHRHSGAEYVEAYRTVRSIGPLLARFFQDHDILLTPTLAAPPRLLGWALVSGIEELVGRLEAAIDSILVAELFGAFEARIENILDFTPYTPLFNFSGHPAMSVPLEWSSTGLPIGLHFGGRYGDEATLFRLAAQLEEARPWRDRLPPIHA